MKKTKILEVLKVGGFGMAGLLIFWYLYRDQNFTNIWQQVVTLNWWWVILGMILSVLSHVSRAARWQILIKSLGYKPRLANTIFAVFIMYLSNLALPRMGEMARCGVMKKYENLPFAQLLGTVVLERLIDMLMLLVLTAIVFFLNSSVFFEFASRNPHIAEKLHDFFSVKTFVLLVGFVAVAVAVWYGFKSMRHISWKPFSKISELLHSFVAGFRTIRTMPGKGWFVFHTLFIWTMYYYMLYVAFFAFDFTSGLSARTALVMFVIGSYGMVAPIQGGIGAWHFMIIQTLILYNLSEGEAATFALIVHAAMNLLLILAGSLSLVAIPIFNRSRNLTDVPISG